MNKNLFRIVVLIAISALLVNNVCALSYSILNHTIEISVNDTGNADVVERFKFYFPSMAQREEFKQTSQTIGLDLEKWETLDPKITTYIGKGRYTIQNISVGFDESSESLELKYSLLEPIMEKIEETSRVTKYSLKANAFSASFDAGDLWKIPVNTTIRLILPTNTELTKTPSPEASIFENKIAWEGYKTSNKLELEYDLIKDIAPTFDIAKVLLSLTSSNLFIPVIGILALVAIVIYVKRSEINSKIENYVIKHSEIVPDEEHFE
ncbi:MAG: hypothetical protein V1672_03880 [Candidatus Diapherotrites archaeon]